MSRDNFSPEKTPGTFAPPPDDAPREVSSTNVAPTPDQVAAAAQNERSLQPLVFTTTPHLNVPKQQVEPRPAKPAVLPAREPNPMPAASDTDSPSRGVPRAISDPGKKITGGFGVAGPPQYFPLDGSELREAVLSLFDQHVKRLQNDLRFHPGITYPRVTVEVVVRVKGWAQDNDFEMKKVTVHDGKITDAVAQEAGLTPVDIEETEILREFAEDGTPENPPDRVRDALGLEKPRKQFVETPTGRQLVDRPNSLLNSF